MGDTFRNMPPLAFGIPMNNTVKYRFKIGGLLLSYGDHNKRAHPGIHGRDRNADSIREGMG